MLLNHLHTTDTWENASKAWQCVLLRPIEIVQRQSDKQYFLVLGHLTHLMLVVWSVESVTLPRTNHLAFLIGGQVVVNKEATVLAVLDLDVFRVIPTLPISPIHYFIACNKKLPPRNRVVLLQFKPSRPVMLHAAYNAFWDIQLPQLTKIVKEYSIDCPCVTLAPTLTAVLRHMIKLHTKKDATDKELQDILALRCADVGDPLEFVCDEDMLVELLEEGDRQEFEDWHKALQRQKHDSKTFRQQLYSGNAGVPAPSADDVSVGSLQRKTKLHLRTAKRYAPRDVLLFHDPVANRLRGYMDKARGPSHGCSLSVEQDVACRVVLKFLWDQHLKRFPDEVCPHDLSYVIA